jgi:outer membrane protein TolC
LIAAVQLIKALGGGWDEKHIFPGSAKSAYRTIPAK